MRLPAVVIALGMILFPPVEQGVELFGARESLFGEPQNFAVYIWYVDGRYMEIVVVTPEPVGEEQE